MAPNANAKNPTLKFLRVLHGLNQTQLGKIIGRTQSTVSLYESGRRVPPKKILNFIEAALGAGIQNFLSGEVRRDE